MRGSPMTVADLAEHLSRAADVKTRLKLVWEFLEEYRWEPDDVQPSLLRDEPTPTGDERWDVLLAALAAPQVTVGAAMLVMILLLASRFTANGPGS
jgi:hypothetical protein